MVKRNYGVAFTIKGKRTEDSSKRYTKKGAVEMVELMIQAQRIGYNHQFKNPTVIKVK